MNGALELLFEQGLEFRSLDGDSIGESVRIGGTEFFAVDVLRDDTAAYREEFDRWLYESWMPEQLELCDRILSLHGNRKRFTDLASAKKRQQVIPLVGSGMSVACGLPTWSNLLRSIRRYTTVREEELEELLADSKYEEAADLLASGTNKNLLNERIEHDLRVDDIREIDGPVRLLPELFDGLVITTNLDNVLEYQYRECSAVFDHVLAGTELARYRRLKNPAERFLLKLHGDTRQAETRVLLTKEYESAYGKGGATREELQLLFRNNHVLFLGCSLGQDRTVELFREVAMSDPNMPRHYAFAKLPKSEEVRVERENFLSERGVFPIWYDCEHTDALIALFAGLIDAAGNAQ